MKEVGEYVVGISKKHFLNIKSKARAVKAESYAVRSGIHMQFKSERSCSLTGICIHDKFNLGDE